MIEYRKFQLNEYDNSVFIADTALKPYIAFDCGKTFFVEAESGKNLETVQKTYDFLLSNNVRRNSRIVAVGGGSVCDLAGFAAATFLRGCRLVLVPTTLLAQIDAAIGGKNGVNFGNVKNLVGSFYPAEQIIVDVSLLTTLPEEQFRYAYAEIIKYSCIDKQVDKTLDLIKTAYADTQLIKNCIDCKTKIVEQDFFDLSIRHVLNAGHTIGHALEIMYGLPHGDAVAQGLWVELFISLQLGLIEDSFYAKKTGQITKFCRINKPVLKEIDNIVEKASHDKKNADGISFSLICNDYRFVQKDFSFEELNAILCRF